MKKNSIETDDVPINPRKKEAKKINKQKNGGKTQFFHRSCSLVARGLA